MRRREFLERETRFNHFLLSLVELKGLVRVKQDKEAPAYIEEMSIDRTWWNPRAFMYFCCCGAIAFLQFPRLLVDDDARTVTSRQPLENVIER